MGFPDPTPPLHLRANQLAQQIGQGVIDLGIVVEIDQHIKATRFGRDEVVHLNEALDQCKHDTLYRNAKSSSSSKNLIESLYLHLQSTGWVSHSSKMLRGFIQENQTRALIEFTQGGPDSVNRDNVGIYLLHGASLFNRKNHLLILLEGGVSPMDTYSYPIERRENFSIRSLETLCPFETAILEGHREIFDTLLSLGCGIEHKSKREQNIILQCTRKYLSKPTLYSARKEKIFNMLNRLAELGVNPHEKGVRFGKLSAIDLLKKFNLTTEEAHLKASFANYCANQLARTTQKISQNGLTSRPRL